MSRVGLRARLTILVTFVFAAALSITSAVVVDAVEGRLIDDTRSSAEAVLSNYLESVYGGVATVGVVDADATNRFFYLDADGNEITERQYFDTIVSSFDPQFLEIIEADPAVPAAIGEGNEVVFGGGLVARSGPVEGFAIDAASGAVSVPELGDITFVAGPVPAGEPQRIDLGADVVAVAQTLTFADGVSLQVGVSSPLRPVTDSLDAITDLLWVAVPALIAAIGAVTWLAAGRALRPVEAIATRADAITSTNMDQRVPVHDANDEIRHLAVTVNKMLGRLQGAHDRHRQLVADASHELRSPVAATRAQLEVAAANPDTADWPRTAQAVLAEQEHLANLIDDLLALSRLDEAGSGVPNDIDLDDLIVDEVDRQAASIELTIEAPVRTRGNPQLLTRAIRNLLDNATRHARQRVTVTLTTSGDNAIIQIDDDGPGIPIDQRERVFDRFTRLDEARDRPTGGAGLGLAIAHEVAQAHRGDLACSDSPRGGARFTLTIPVEPGTSRGVSPEPG